MEKSSEALFRSTLHDMANVLAGIRGIVDLSPQGQPLSLRDRDRLGAVIDEGIAALERSRHLAMGTLPEAGLEPGETWREALREDLEPLGLLFRCRFDLAGPGTAQWDQWPGKLLRGYVRAVTRLALPYAKAPSMVIETTAGPEGWGNPVDPAPVIPEALAPGPEDRTLDVCGRWAVRVGSALGISLSSEAGSLVARVPRAPAG